MQSYQTTPSHTNEKVSFFKLEDLKAQEGFLQKLGTMKGKLPPKYFTKLYFHGTFVPGSCPFQNMPKRFGDIFANRSMTMTNRG